MIQKIQQQHTSYAVYNHKIPVSMLREPVISSINCSNLSVRHPQIEIIEAVLLLWGDGRYSLCVLIGQWSIHSLFPFLYSCQVIVSCVRVLFSRKYKLHTNTISSSSAGCPRIGSWQMLCLRIFVGTEHL